MYTNHVQLLDMHKTYYHTNSRHDLVSDWLTLPDCNTTSTKRSFIEEWCIQGSTLTTNSKQYINHNFSSTTRIKLILSVLKSSRQALSIYGTSSLKYESFVNQLNSREGHLVRFWTAGGKKSYAPC